MARSRDRDPAIWAVICFLFPLIGVLALAISGGAPRSSANRGVAGEEGKKWQVLQELDPDIRAAADRIREADPSYEGLLAQKYMALNDKNYLKAAEEAVMQQIDLDRSTRAETFAQYEKSNKEAAERLRKYPMADKIGIFAVLSGLVLLVVSLSFGRPVLIPIWLLAVVAYAGFLGSKGVDRSKLLQMAAGVALTSPIIAFFAYMVEAIPSHSRFHDGMSAAMGALVVAIVVAALAPGAAYLSGLVFAKAKKP